MSATGAKVGLLFGLAFYVVTYYVLEINLHFVHIWGIEFVLIIIVMHIASWPYAKTASFKIEDSGVVNIRPWKYAKLFSVILVLVTIVIYILLGNV